MKKISLILCLLFLVTLLFLPVKILAVQADATITGMFSGVPISIKTAAKWAGAIDSLTWKNKEFVLSVENGQQIQVAITPNNWGGCYNPTESGSAKDFKGPDTSSKFLSYLAHDNVIETTNQMAFWLDPIVNTGLGGCIMKKNPSPADAWWNGYPLHDGVLSDFILHKKVTIGFRGIPNVIVHEVTVDVPTDLKVNMARFNQTMDQVPANERNYDTSLRYIILENPATYVPIEFSLMYRYDPKLSPYKESLVSKSNSDLNILPIPPILSTPDEQYAIGLYTPEILDNYQGQEQYPLLGYELNDWNIPDWGENRTMLLGTRMPKIPVNNIVTSTSYLIIGSLSDVQSSMHKLYLIFNPSSTITPSPTDSPLLGDLNDDGKVNIQDYYQIVTDFGKIGSSGWILADVNQDGKVDIFDYNTLIGNFGK